MRINKYRCDVSEGGGLVDSAGGERVFGLWLQSAGDRSTRSESS